MSIKHFIHEIEKGLHSTVYLLYGDEPYLLKEASIMCSQTIPEQDRSFCLDVIDLEDKDQAIPFAQVLDVLNTMPFIGSRKVVVIENIQALAKKEMILLDGYVSNPSPYSLLVLLHRGALKGQFKDMDKKVRLLSLDIRQQDLPLWIKEKARQKGLDLTNRATEYLIDIMGYDVGLISSELEKFMLLGKNRIDIQDIIEVVKGNSDYNAFDLASALKSKDRERVFRISRKLQQTQEPFNIIGAINWQYSKMASFDRDKNRSYYDKVFSLLNEADIKIKTSGGTFPLEYLLIRLLQL